MSLLIDTSITMACVCGFYYTVTISDCGDVYSFGANKSGQLGFGHNGTVTLPLRIPSLSQIKQVSCGPDFTICVDYEGFIWSFGQNLYGQLGTGNTTNFDVPQQIQHIPPVLSVSCGYSHTLIVTNNFDLWSCGANENGELCLNNQESKKIFTKTSFSNIKKTSCGYYTSLFQNEEGEIYACGNNVAGQLGLGSFRDKFITPTIISNLPLSIIQFVCGYWHCLFLDSEGKVFSVGNNKYGQLGNGYHKKQNTVIQIPNIPPVQSISCGFHSSYFIDIEGYLWSFGSNGHGKLGHGDKIPRFSPTKIECLRDIKQISYGFCANGHFLAKDYENKIFVVGYNNSGQLGTGNTESSLVVEEMDSQYFPIWGDILQSRCKSARK